LRYIVALPSSAHIYRLLIVKELVLPLRRIPATSLTTPSNRFVRQQQRDEIMRRFSFSVNYFVSLPTQNIALPALLFHLPLPLRATLPAAFCTSFCKGRRTISKVLKRGKHRDKKYPRSGKFDRPANASPALAIIQAAKQ